MGCNCRGTSRKGPANGEVKGYEYIDPRGRSSLKLNGALFMTLSEARAEQRSQGGGTIRTHRVGKTQA